MEQQQIRDKRVANKAVNFKDDQNPTQLIKVSDISIDWEHNLRH